MEFQQCRRRSIVPESRHNSGTVLLDNENFRLKSFVVQYLHLFDLDDDSYIAKKKGQ